MDLSELKGIISLMQKSDLSELEINIPDLKLRLARPGTTSSQSPGSFPVEVAQHPIAAQVQPPQSVVTEPQKQDDGLHLFSSPMVGTFYRKPSPEDAFFVEVGDIVKKGDVLCIIEAMKVMNEIQSDVAGEIVEVLIEDGTSVEYGQTLFNIRKT